MNIVPYKNLIKNIPYKEQSFIPNENRWSNILNSLNIHLNIDWQRGYSRNELFNMPLSDEKIIAILMWGYPGGGRGNNIKSILKHCEKILSSIISYNNKNVNRNEIVCMASKLDKIKHLGRSTWSKILYFCNIKFNNHRLLILDERIKNCVSDIEINGIKFTKITNNIETYVDYNSSMTKIASKYKFKADQLELFIFLFAKIFRLRNGV